ncbi:hypothetical protein [Kitasatospora sp. NPDC085879]|uniref:hypothetical protein n=1 Tax=Kitasatospora sp. NPDC085879 TaxID=3154769 RepID=UPI00341AC330
MPTNHNNTHRQLTSPGRFHADELITTAMVADSAADVARHARSRHPEQWGLSPSSSGKTDFFSPPGNFYRPLTLVLSAQ